jgi:hypothetical protein
MKGLYLYPEVDGGSMSASPRKNQKEYDLYKSGVIKNLFTPSTRESRKKYRQELYAEIEVSDVRLKEMVDEIFAKQYRKSSYNILIESKTHPLARKHYYAFINSYNSDKGNVCCLTVDSAKEIMKKK